MFKTLKTLRAISKLDASELCPDINPLFDLWEAIEVFTKDSFTGKVHEPMVLSTGLVFIDNMICVKTAKRSGIAGGSWWTLTGDPGTGKTTLGLQVLKACMAQGAEVAWFDFEMMEFKGQRLLSDLDASEIEHVICYVGDVPTKIFEHADAHKDKMVVALVDSFDFLTEKATSYDEQRELAQRLREGCHQRPNLILITINHKLKDGKVAGAAEIGRYCDVRIDLKRKNKQFTIMTTPKCRDAADDAPVANKLTWAPEHKGHMLSTEPDFVTDNPIVGGVRTLWGKMMKKRE